MDSVRPDSQSQTDLLEVRLLGPMSIRRNGAAQALPTSRKVRALLGYLALAPRAVTRSQLCDLLWDVPNDPRGELRWCLSKLRSVIDDPDHRRIDTPSDSVRLELEGCFVDVVEISRAMQQGIDTLSQPSLRTLAALFAGDFLEGLEIDRSPVFNGWLVAQRRHFREWHANVLEHLVANAADEDVFGHLEKWLQLAPFERRVHEALLNALARRGRFREGEEHLTATTRLFESEGLDCTLLRTAWRDARSHADAQPKAIASPVQMPVAPVERPDGGAIEPHRASIAVMPFVDQTPGGGPGNRGDGLAHDVITRLAKLRSLFVIAQGTVFALRDRNVTPEEAGRLLHVEYVLSGSLRRDDRRLTVTVELVETRTSRIVWNETFDHRIDDALHMFDEIGNRIVASIAHEIETIERNRAILRPPNSLDAWEAHHRGLWHMYKFSRPDNEKAMHFFEMAVNLDPTFARAHAGLSFTHFQNAFLGWADRSTAVDRAFESAGQSLMVDDRDPAAHWAMGRALWLRGQHDQSLVELENAIDISPNFALAHYTLSFVHSQSGDPRAAIRSSDYSRHLSPFDPLLFAMLGARAMALVRLKQFDEAAEWAIKGAARPNAHAHVLAIAAYCLALAGRLDEARAHLARARRSVPAYSVENFLTGMQFDSEGAALFRTAAKRID